MFRKRDIGNLLERSLNPLYRCSELAGSSYDVAQAYLWRYTKAKAKAYGEAVQRREARERGVERAIEPRGDALVVAAVSRFCKRSQSAELGVVQDRRRMNERSIVVVVENCHHGNFVMVLIAIAWISAGHLFNLSINHSD
ncbi:hypothetical protein GGX14DRAFT_394030 [Mycena pura]|uniref:Uncharacterized protein n=1 Tax=Mycena pura TaxID=153505 RepID=A0AAD6VG57_9AGAR|nr:hypothetical protein GGX14DRAFT_394030 [Mycena pura]